MQSYTFFIEWASRHQWLKQRKTIAKIEGLDDNLTIIVKKIKLIRKIAEFSLFLWSKSEVRRKYLLLNVMEYFIDFNKIYRKICERSYALFDIKYRKIDNSFFKLSHSAFILCDCGKCEFEVNGKRLEIAAGMRASIMRVDVIHMLSMSEDFHAWMLIAEDRLWLNLMIGIPTQMLQSLDNETVVHVADEREWQMLQNFILNIHLYEQLEMPVASNLMVATIIRAMITLMGEMAYKRNEQKEYPEYSMADTYFRDFIALLNDNVDREHEVKFYAGKLGISTKYLSDITKAKVGNSAKDVISFFLISRLKVEILGSGQSLKTLAYRFAFADQSSMGKFFRKMEGISPLEFKRRNSITTMRE